MAGWRTIGLGLAALLLASCGQGPATDTPAEADGDHLSPDASAAAERAALGRCGHVTVEGYCGLKFGMPANEATRQFPVALEGYEAQPGVDTSAEACHELFAAAPVTGISFVVEGGRIGRVDVISETARTTEGFGVGTQASAIRTRFGDKLGVDVNPLEPDIVDLSIAEGPTKFVFEIQDGVVRSWRAGVAPTIDYPAHCS